MAMTRQRGELAFDPSLELFLLFRFLAVQALVSAHPLEWQCVAEIEEAFVPLHLLQAVYHLDMRHGFVANLVLLQPGLAADIVHYMPKADVLLRRAVLYLFVIADPTVSIAYQSNEPRSAVVNAAQAHMENVALSVAIGFLHAAPKVDRTEAVSFLTQFRREAAKGVLAEIIAFCVHIRKGAGDEDAKRMLAKFFCIIDHSAHPFHYVQLMPVRSTTVLVHSVYGKPVVALFRSEICSINPSFDSFRSLLVCTKVCFV